MVEISKHTITTATIKLCCTSRTTSQLIHKVYHFYVVHTQSKFILCYLSVVNGNCENVVEKIYFPPWLHICIHRVFFSIHLSCSLYCLQCFCKFAVIKYLLVKVKKMRCVIISENKCVSRC